MNETTLLSALHALQQRRVREWDNLDTAARRHLLLAIKEVRFEIMQRDRERKAFTASWGRP